MIRSRATALVLAGVTIFAGDVLATTGGPEVAHLLGWDPVDRKVFFSIEKKDESGEVPAVVYFTVAESPAPRPMQVEWSKQRTLGDSLYASRLRSLTRRLQPLTEIEGPTVFHYTSTLAVDTVDVWKMPRYLVQVSDHNLCNEIFQVTTVCEPSVRMIRRYAIPGRKERVSVLSFRATPWEVGYEVQWPVLLREPGSLRSESARQRIEWKRWE